MSCIWVKGHIQDIFRNASGKLVHNLKAVERKVNLMLENAESKKSFQDFTFASSQGRPQRQFIVDESQTHASSLRWFTNKTEIVKRYIETPQLNKLSRTF